MINNNLLNVLPNDDVLSQCIHCGLCLAVCPTYNMSFVERSSPRGRIKMIKAVAYNELAISDIFADEMDFCLDCQACESACPAGVQYGSMVEAARVELEHAGYTTFFGRIVKTVSLKYILKYRWIMNLVARFLFIYQRSGLKTFLHKSGLFKALLPKLGEMDKLAPNISKKFSSKTIKEITPAKGTKKYKTAFLTGCVMDIAFAEINTDTVDLLSLTGCEVFTPKQQYCCGSIHAHNGDFETAKELAKKNIDAFGSDYDYLVSNSAGCGAFMKEYGHVLADDKDYAEKAKLFSSKVKDVSEFVDEHLKEIKLNAIEGNVTYHDACHLAHTQKITEQPRNVLNSIPGLKVSALNESTWCCGSAGIYNIVRYDESMTILDRKMENIRKTGAKTVLASNPGCILQLQYGAEKFKVPVEVLHPSTIIKRSLEAK